MATLQMDELSEEEEDARPAPAELVVLTKGGDTDFILPLTGAGFGWVIGSAATCDIVLDRPGVSKQHARLEFDGAHSWFLTDLGSTNKTRLNGRVLDPNVRAMWPKDGCAMFASTRVKVRMLGGADEDGGADVDGTPPLDDVDTGEPAPPVPARLDEPHPDSPRPGDEPPSQVVGSPLGSEFNGDGVASPVLEDDAGDARGEAPPPPPPALPPPSGGAVPGDADGDNDSVCSLETAPPEGEDEGGAEARDGTAEPGLGEGAPADARPHASPPPLTSTPPVPVSPYDAATEQLPAAAAGALEPARVGTEPAAAPGGMQVDNDATQVWEGPGDADDESADLDTDAPDPPDPDPNAFAETQVIEPGGADDAAGPAAAAETEAHGASGELDAGHSLSPAYGEGELGAAPTTVPVEGTMPSVVAAPRGGAAATEPEPGATEPPVPPPSLGATEAVGAEPSSVGPEACEPTQVMLPEADADGADADDHGAEHATRAAEGSPTRANGAADAAARAAAPEARAGAQQASGAQPAGPEAGARGARSRGARGAARPPPVPHRSRQTKQLVAAASQPAASPGALIDTSWTQTQTPSQPSVAAAAQPAAAAAGAVLDSAAVAARAASAEPATAAPGAADEELAPAQPEVKGRASRSRPAARAAAEPAASKPARGRGAKSRTAAAPAADAVAEPAADAEPAGSRRRGRASADERSTRPRGAPPASEPADIEAPDPATEPTAEPHADPPPRAASRADKVRGGRRAAAVPTASAAGGAAGAPKRGGPRATPASAAPAPATPPAAMDVDEEGEAKEEPPARRGRGRPAQPRGKTRSAPQAAESAAPAKASSARAPDTGGSGDPPASARPSKRRGSRAADAPTQSEAAAAPAADAASEEPAAKRARGEGGGARAATAAHGAAAAASEEKAKPTPGRKRARSDAAAAAPQPQPSAAPLAADSAAAVVPHRPGEVRVLFTCFEDSAREAALKKTVKECGGKVLESAAEAPSCTHCVVDRTTVKRTVKLCIAVSARARARSLARARDVCAHPCLCAVHAARPAQPRARRAACIMTCPLPPALAARVCARAARTPPRRRRVAGRERARTRLCRRGAVRAQRHFQLSARGVVQVVVQRAGVAGPGGR